MHISNVNISQMVIDKSNNIATKYEVTCCLSIAYLNLTLAYYEGQLDHCVAQKCLALFTMKAISVLKIGL